VTLPAATGEQPFVQLRWKYYHISGASGSRAQLRVGDIRVSAAEPPPRLTATLSDEQRVLQLQFRSEDGGSSVTYSRLAPCRLLHSRSYVAEG
jgi:hypothetical protein